MIKIHLILMLLMSQSILAQTITGKIVESEANKPLHNVNVFLAGTLIGTITDRDGNFKLDIKENFSNPLIVSFVGYETRIFSLNNLKATSEIALSKKTKDLPEINVTAIPCSWSRRKMMQVFKKEFLGATENAKSCEILNENDVYLFYNDSTKVLHAHSKKPLIIYNRMLGYQIIYLLEHFEHSDEGTGYRGYNNFTELEPDIKSLKKRITEARRDTYFGSTMHFMRYLYNDNVHFRDTIYNFKIISRNNFYVEQDIQIISEIVPKNCYEPANMDTIKSRLYTESGLDKVFKRYHLYDEDGNYMTTRRIVCRNSNSRELSYLGKIRIIYYPKFMMSNLVPKADCIEIAKNGYYNPDLISWYGGVSKYRVGDMLPYDYNP